MGDIIEGRMFARGWHIIVSLQCIYVYMYMNTLYPSLGGGRLHIGVWLGVFGVA